MRLIRVFTGTKCRVILSKHVTIACDSAEKTIWTMKTCFHKPKGGFLHRCQRHHHALRCFLGFSFILIEKKTRNTNIFLKKQNSIIIW